MNYNNYGYDQQYIQQSSSYTTQMPGTSFASGSPADLNQMYADYYAQNPQAYQSYQTTTQAYGDYQNPSGSNSYQPQPPAYGIVSEKQQQLQNYYAEIHGSDPFAPQGSDTYYLDQAKYDEGGDQQNNRNKKYNQKTMMKEKLQQQQEYLKEAQMTEQQKNARVVEEILNSKEHEQEKRVKEIEKQVMDELQKCTLHPLNIFQNQKCRQCKKIREEFEIRKQQKLEEINAKNEQINGPDSTIVKVDISKLINTNQPFPTNCEPKTGNLPDMLRNNILSSQYFKELYQLKSFNEVCEEIKTHVTYGEPWVPGANGVPSSLFCCLYKLMLMRLSEKQVQQLLKYKLSPYVRSCGALFVRFLSPYEQMFDRLAPFILDDQEFNHSIDKTKKTTFGEYVEQLLGEKNYFNIVLPRIPVLINREIQKKLLSLPEKRQRKRENQAKSRFFKKGMTIYALSKKDQQWHRAKINMVLYKAIYGGIRHKVQENYEMNEGFFDQEEEDFDIEEDDADEDEQIVAKLQVKFIEGFGDDEHSQEFLGLEDVLFLTESERRELEESEQKKKKHRTEDDQNIADDNSWGGENEKRIRRSRSRSREDEGQFKAPNDRRKQDADRQLQEVIQRERDMAAAQRKEEYAKRPASYKSSLSLALPVGTTRKKEKTRDDSPERQHIYIQNPAAYKEEEAEHDRNKQENKEKELEKIKILKEKYGDASALSKINKKE